MSLPGHMGAVNEFVYIGQCRLLIGGRPGNCGQSSSKSASSWMTSFWIAATVLPGKPLCGLATRRTKLLNLGVIHDALPLMTQCEPAIAGLKLMMC